MRILAIDPSGSFKEGKGTSGWVLFEDWDTISYGQLKSKDYESREEYWLSHYKLILKHQPDLVVVEDFRLYRSKATSQINSELETSKLLGYLEMSMYSSGISYVTQMAVQAKTRYTDKILVHKNYITIKNKRYYINGINVSGHVIDALRHGLFYQLKRMIKESKQ